MQYHFRNDIFVIQSTNLLHRTTFCRNTDMCGHSEYQKTRDLLTTINFIGMFQHVSTKQRPGHVETFQ
jgi:hypothetical protein